MTIAVVTAIFDNYDVLHPMRWKGVQEAVCVTDNPELKGEGWKIVVKSRPPGEAGRMACKHPKCFPWAYCVSLHTHYITLDGAMDLKDVEVDVRDLLPHHALIGQWPNMYRSCPYAEGIVSRDIDKYKHDRLDEQMAFYQSEGLPPSSGLWSCGLIIRRDNPIVREFEATWFQEMQRWGVQDQVSHAYAAWRTGIKPHTIREGTVAENELVTWRGHIA